MARTRRSIWPVVMSRRPHLWFAYNDLSADGGHRVSGDRITNIQNAIDTRRLVAARDAVPPRSFYAGTRYVFIDGMPLVLTGHLLGYQLRGEHKMPSIDWLPPLLPTAIRAGWRVFFLKHMPTDPPWRAAILGAQFPGLKTGCEHGYFDSGLPSETGEALLGRVRAFRLHIL